MAHGRTMILRLVDASAAILLAASGIAVLFRTYDPDMLYELPRSNSYAMAETLNKNWFV